MIRYATALVAATLILSAVRTDAAEPPKPPAIDVHSFRTDGPTVAWDFTLHAYAGKLPAGAAATAMVEFVDAASAKNVITLPLAKATLAADGPRAGLRGTTEIGERFAEGYYAVTLKVRVGTAAETAARLGVLVVKHRRQFLSFIPDDPASAAYPPEIRAWTEPIKQAQRDAGTKLMADLDAALKAGKKEFRIPTGHYRLTLGGKPKSGRPRYFEWKDIADFTLDGQGSTLWFDAIGPNGFLLSRCRNVTFRNLVIDYDPLPFAQGKVVAIDETTKRLRFRLDDGFEPSMTPFLANKSLLRLQAFYDDSSRGRVMRSDWTAGHTANRPVVSVGEGLYECPLVLRYKTPEASGIGVGDAVALCPRSSGTAFAISYCDGLRFENITIYAVALDGTSDRFSAFAGGKGTVYDGFRIMRRPNTRRLVSANSSGVFVTSMGKGFAATNCVFEGTMDDCLPIQSFNPLVVRQNTPTEIVVAQRSGSLPIGLPKGHTLDFYDLATLAPKGHAKIVAIEAHDEPGLAEKEAARKRFVWNPTEFYKVTLSAALVLAPMDMIIVAEVPSAADFRIENCFFYSGWARSVYATGERGVIRGNTFEAGGRLNIGPSTAWLIGSFARDILIENNRMIDISCSPQEPLDGVPIVIVGPKAHALNSKIVIRGNTIERSTYAGIVVLGTDGVIITGNTLKQTNQKKYDVPAEGLDLNKPIVIQACKNVVEKDNVVRK